METNTMRVVLVTALIENYYDVKSAEEGLISDVKVRRLEVPDARVDTGATYVSMPLRLINQLESTSATSPRHARMARRSCRGRL